MSVLNDLHSTCSKRIQDPFLIRRLYRHWRVRIFYAMYIGYALYYFSRKSLACVAPTLIAEASFTKEHIGFLGSLLSLAYGGSKFISGVMGDRSNPRYFMAIGLMITGFLNVFFGLTESIVWLSLFWALNGWFQGWGWPACAKLLTHWYASSERGRWWGVWNTSHNVGGALVPLVTALAVSYGGWRYGFFAPGAICVMGAFFLMNRLGNTPQSLGLPKIEHFVHPMCHSCDLPKSSHQNAPSTWRGLLSHVLSNRAIWLLALAYFFVYVVRSAMNDWTLLYLMEQKHYAPTSVQPFLVWFEIGGLLGGLSAGWLSDVWFSGKRGRANLLFTVGAVVSISAFYSAQISSPWFDSLFIFLIGFFIFGPQMLIGMIAAEVSHKSAAGTSTGFVGWFAYLGAACAGWPIGKLVTLWGWEGFFYSMITCGVISMLLLIPFWSIRTEESE